MKKALLVVAVSLVASVSFAKNYKIIVCSNENNSVELKIIGNEVVAFIVTAAMEYSNLEPFSWTAEDGSTHYSIRVDDAYDTNTWFDIYLKNGEIVRRELAINGNDSDNYKGSVVAEGDAAFTCSEQ